MDKLLDTATSFVTETGRLFGDIIDSFSGNEKIKGYSASFGKEKELLSERHRGFCLNGRKHISLDLTYRGSYIQAPSGGGKSTAVLWPNIFRVQDNASLVIHDPSSELISRSGSFLKEVRGYDVKVLRFGDPSTSDGFNPLERANTKSEIQKVASLLVETSLGGNQKSDPFWNSMAVSLLSILISIVKTQDKQYQNLYNVRQLLNQINVSDTETVSPVDELFKVHADDVLFGEYNSFLQYDPKLITSCIATCKSALQIFADEDCAKVTSFDTINMQDFRTKKIALFINTAITDQRYYNVLTNIFAEQFFAEILSRIPAPEERDIFFLLDECSSLKLPTLPLVAANIRKSRGALMVVVQDFRQLVRSYGKDDAEAIRSNLYSRLYFTGQALETARELESILGKTEYEDEDKRKHVRNLMSADEIRTMPADRAILICGHHKPIKVRLYPYYEDRTMKRYSELPQIAFASKLPFFSIPTLPLPTQKI
jgi:type IV secretion system protein VirD4